MRFLLLVLLIFSFCDSQAGWRFSQPKGKFKGLCSLENSIYQKNRGSLSFVIFYYNTENMMNPVLAQISSANTVTVMFSTSLKKVSAGESAQLKGPNLDRDYANYQVVDFRGRKVMFYTVDTRLQKIILDNLKFGNQFSIQVPLKNHGLTSYTIQPFSISNYKKFVACTKSL